MINVLVVDDSAVARAVLVELLGSDPAICVVGTASDGEEAVAANARLKPDLITMDIHMPRMNGTTAIREIMQTLPTPIVVVTGNEITAEVRATFESLESGALAIVSRPCGYGPAAGDADSQRLLQTVKTMAEVKVVRRWNRSPARGESASPLPDIEINRPRPRLIAIGASTGGPVALKSILSGLRPSASPALAIVQHIAPGFMAGFASWLSNASGWPVIIATAGLTVQPGHAYLAPEGMHLGFDASERTKLEPGDKSALIVPSASHLFKSVARTFGPAAVGILLTGMGRDGADGLLALRKAGGLTLAQDRESSIVFGMPGEAVRLNAALHVLPPDKIVKLLAAHCSVGL
jgi:two-component system chemotaxis response regulator CheB